MTRRQRDLHVIVENVHDPHNVGAILRSCDAVGAGAAHLVYHPSTELGAGSGQKAPNLRDLRTKAAASAAKWLTIKKWGSVEECVSFFRSVGADGIRPKTSGQIYRGARRAPLRIFVATLSDQGRAPWDFDLASPCAIAVGNEHDGPSAELVAAADGVITIPMQGFVESFNVSVAAAICLAEAMRQRVERGMYAKT